MGFCTVPAESWLSIKAFLQYWLCRWGNTLFEIPGIHFKVRIIHLVLILGALWIWSVDRRQRNETGEGLFENIFEWGD